MQHLPLAAPEGREPGIPPSRATLSDFKGSGLLYRALRTESKLGAGGVSISGSPAHKTKGTGQPS